MFAQAVADAGLTWIGPTPESIDAMALKVEAKRLVAAAGVPLVPGAELAADATERTSPLPAPRSATRCWSRHRRAAAARACAWSARPTTCSRPCSAARSEAASAFGDPTVFLERYLERGRHVEVQVFGDTHGSVVHAFERECSIQRRHQKVVEESPSPGATPATLERMYAAAVAAARAIDYVGAGTVEFMVDRGGPGPEFFFLEMNTRLQVEHPVTEVVTGLDLVEWQIRVAAGEPLPLAQEPIARSGHAIEVRLYAEDPARGYLPGMGRIECFEVDPAPGIRVETGVETGSEVSAYYDPMLAKVIARGATRELAAATLASSLEGLRVAGVPTNRESLAAVLRAPAFLAGDTTTAFLDEHPETAAPQVERRELALHLAAAALGLAEQERVGQPWAALAPAGWRNIPAVPEVRRFGYGELGADLSLEVRYTRDRAGGVDIALAPDERSADPGLPAHLRVDRTRAHGSGVMVEVDGVGGWFDVRRAGDWVLVTGLGRATTLRVLPRFPEASAHGHDHGLTTPVPGTVTAVLVAAGDAVAAGDTLVILEAMKMEHRIKADGDGVVAEVRVAVGDSVDAHHVVAVLEEE